VSLDPLLGVNYFVINEMKSLFKKKKKKKKKSNTTPKICRTEKKKVGDGYDLKIFIVINARKKHSYVFLSMIQ